MAIDDNTSYELTGYQVKDLAGRIRRKADTSSLAPVASSGDYDDLTNKPDLSGYVTISTDQDITGQKTFKEVTNIQNGQGTGSLWVGGNVNASGATNNNRHLARIVAPSFANASLGATMLGFDTSGDSDMHVANKTHDALSFGGMKKITNATSPMAIGFCVANTRGATAASNKVYPLEMDASEARFNVQPNYNGTNLALATDIPTVNNGTLTIQQNGTTVGTFTANQSADTTISLAGGVYADDPTSPATPTPWITPGDVDTTTFPGASGVTTLTGSMSGTSWADVSNCSFTTTQAGLYWIGYEISSAYVGAHEFSIDGRINIGGTNYAGCSQFSIRNWAGNYGASNSNSLIQWIPANTTVKMQARMSNYSGGVNCAMNYIQIY